MVYFARQCNSSWLDWTLCFQLLVMSACHHLCVCVRAHTWSALFCSLSGCCVFLSHQRLLWSANRDWQISFELTSVITICFYVDVSCFVLFKEPLLGSAGSVCACMKGQWHWGMAGELTSPSHVLDSEKTACAYKCIALFIYFKGQSPRAVERELRQRCSLQWNGIFSSVVIYRASQKFLEVTSNVWSCSMNWDQLLTFSLNNRCK